MKHFLHTLLCAWFVWQQTVTTYSGLPDRLTLTSVIQLVVRVHEYWRPTGWRILFIYDTMEDCEKAEKNLQASPMGEYRSFRDEGVLVGKQTTFMCLPQGLKPDDRS